MKRADALILINEILKTGYALNDWELRFMDSIRRSGIMKLSEKQASVLQKTYEKATEQLLNR